MTRPARSGDCSSDVVVAHIGVMDKATLKVVYFASSKDATTTNDMTEI